MEGMAEGLLVAHQQGDKLWMPICLSIKKHIKPEYFSCSAPICIKKNKIHQRPKQN